MGIKAMDNANSFITVDVVVTQITLKHLKNATKNVRTSKKILKVLKPKMTKAFVSYHQPLAIVAQLYQDGILMMNRKNVKSLSGVDAMEMQTISLQNRNVKLCKDEPPSEERQNASEAKSEDTSEVNEGSTNAICNLPEDGGRCRALLERYRFNPETRKCEIFQYGVCGGNENNFEDIKDCEKACILK